MTLADRKSGSADRIQRVCTSVDSQNIHCFVKLSLAFHIRRLRIIEESSFLEQAYTVEASDLFISSI